MSIKITRNIIDKGNTLLNDLWDEVLDGKQTPDSSISDCIDLVLSYDRAKTYKYILLTQLLGKAVVVETNILAMKASSTLEGAWDARNLCEGVITKGGFEKSVLMGVLGRSKQPYNSSPAQKPELSKSNHTRLSDIPLRDALIDALSRIETADDAIESIRYFLFVCKGQIETLAQEEPMPVYSGDAASCALARQFWMRLARIGHEGEGLSLALATLLKLCLGNGYDPLLYQINTFRPDRGDLVLLHSNERFATFEIKDKPFTVHEVTEYADNAFSHGWVRFAFVYGRNAGHPGPILSDRRLADYADRGLMAACISFEALLDSVLMTVDFVPLDELRRALISYIDDANISIETANPARSLLRELLSEVAK